MLRNRQPIVVKRPVFIVFFLALLAFYSTPFADAYVLTFTPRASVSQYFTDNLYLASDEDKQYDFITTVSPGFSGGIAFRNSGIEFSYDPEYSSYTRFDENNTLRHDAEIEAWTKPSRNTRLTLSDSFYRTEVPVTEDIGDEGDETVEYDRDTRLPYYSNTATIEFLNQFDKDSYVEIGHDYGILKNEDPEVSDNMSYKPYIDLTYWFSPNSWGIQTGGRVIKGVYDEEVNDFTNYYGNTRMIARVNRHLDTSVGYAHTEMVYDGDNENYSIYNPYVGIDWAISEDSNFAIDAGYFMRDRETSEDEDGFTIDGDLATSWRFRRGSIRLSGSSGYRESYLDAENLGFSMYYGADCDAEYGFTKEIRGYLFTSYDVDEYQDAAPGEEGRTDYRTKVGGGITSIAYRWLRLRLEYAFRFLDSTEDDYDYRENRVLLRISVVPPRPFRAVR